MRLLENEKVDYDIESKYKDELEYLRKERAVQIYQTIK